MVHLLPLGESKLPLIASKDCVPPLPLLQPPGQPAASLLLLGFPYPLPLSSQDGVQEALPIRMSRSILSTTGSSRLATSGLPLQGGKQRLLK